MGHRQSRQPRWCDLAPRRRHRDNSAHRRREPILLLDLLWGWVCCPGRVTMWYRACVDLVVVGHLLFIGFVVGGVFLTWRWPVIIWAHIPAVIYGALVEFAGFTCPLTLLENDLRQRAGEAGYRGGFISHYLVEVIYPSGLTHGMQIGLGLLLLVVAIIGYRASCAGTPHQPKRRPCHEAIVASERSALRGWAPGSGPILACGQTR